MISIKIQVNFVSNNLFFGFPHSINHLVQHFKNNISTEKMILNLPAHLIVFENIKQYF
mgnify:CR=1 FL=1